MSSNIRMVAETTCPICANSGPKERIELTERMFGFGGSFEYLRCQGCGLLWLPEVPENLGDYYPSHYCSFDAPPEVYRYDTSLKWRILQHRDRYEWTGQGAFGKFLAKQKPNPQDKRLWPLGIKVGDKVLDVGCGNGLLITKIHAVGIVTHGVDPFIEKEIGSREEGFWIRKAFLSDIEEKYDVVMLHHSLEHMPDQNDTFHHIRRILNPGGRVMIRIPTISCEAWDRYREYWYELDAPRHLFLHSRKSIQALAEKHGFKLDSIRDDAMSDQFSMSELYKLGLPLRTQDPETKKQIDEALAKMPVADYEKETERLNREGKGCRIALVLHAV